MKLYRRRNRIRIKDECNKIYDMYKNSDSFDSLQTRCISHHCYTSIRRPWKIGYRLNTPINLTYIQNRICNNAMQKDLKTLGTNDKLSILINANNLLFDDYSDWTFLDNKKILTDMKKQISRRGCVGYFKGH
jgi:hypothetical protein